MLFFRVFSQRKVIEEDIEHEIKLIIVSVSVQPVLSLAARYDLSPEDTFQKLAGKFEL